MSSKIKAKKGQPSEELKTLRLPMSSGRNKFLDMMLMVEDGITVILTRYGRDIAVIESIKKETRKSLKGA